MYQDRDRYGPPPLRAGGPRPVRWIVSAAVVVLAAAAVIGVVLAGSGRTHAHEASRSPVPSADVAPAGGAPTTDELPDNSASSSCSKAVGAQLAAVSVATVVGLVRQGGKPDAYVRDVLRDCTSSIVRSRIAILYGVQFGSDYSNDLTGAGNDGETARYRVANANHTGELTLTLTRQRDGHYEVTGFSYSG